MPLKTLGFFHQVTQPPQANLAPNHPADVCRINF